jgi:hypothetical protein
MVSSLAPAMIAVLFFCLPAQSQAAGEHTLTVQQGSSLGIGGVRSDDGRLECNGPRPCEASFPEGAVVTLTATAGTESAFEGFGGDCSGTTCTLTMTSNHNVEYFFFWTPRLVVHPEGTGAGWVESEPPGIDCGLNLPGHEQCMAEFPAGYVNLTSHPDPHSLFNGFNSPDCSGLAMNCFTTLTTATEVHVSFVAGAHPLTVTVAGDGEGRVAGSGPVYPEYISCGPENSVCGRSFPGGETVTLEAIPEPGSEFTGWSGDCSGTADNCTLTMDADLSAEATFAKEPVKPPVEPPIGSPVEPPVKPPVEPPATGGRTTTASVTTATSATPPPAAPPAGPSNGFQLGKPIVDKRKGTAKVKVVLPGPGQVTLTGKGVKSVAKQVKVAGPLILPIGPTGALATGLRHAGRGAATLKVTFTPSGGSAATKQLRVILLHSH